MKSYALVLAAGVALSGCALKGDVRRVEQQLATYRDETARADSARAVMLARLLDELDALNRQATVILDSLSSQNQAFFQLQGSVRGELTEIQRQLLAIQELTGQSQARLAELRREFDRRDVGATPTPGGGRGEPGAAAPAEAGRGDLPGPEEMLQIGMQQLRRSSRTTARTVFQQLVTTYPSHQRVADALFFIGDSFREEDADSARTYFERVVTEFPASQRAPTALYRIGLDAERRGDVEAARAAYERVIAGYPRSEEAELARAKLGNP